ncbi:unnamed protein product [Sphagnum jensenii]|uniref:Uncharacterized protein n=1 Tax=Sphagnum jensenii TaxID=128206 RepID=A0ABP0X159_9BRYO
MPDLGDHLRGGGVPEVEVVDELDDSRGRVSGYFERGAVPFLRENSNRGEVVMKKGMDLVACGPKLAAGKSSPEFQCQDLVGKGVHNVVDPFQ